MSDNETDTKIVTPLSKSLLAVASLPTCPFTPGFFDNVPSERQPRTLKGMVDYAEYFVRKDTDPLVMTFPAEIDYHGKYSRMAPYFNLPQSVFPFYTYIFKSYEPYTVEIEVRDLRKCRAQFELRLLNESDCPIAAVKASWSAYEAALALYNEVETERNGCMISYLTS